MSFPGIDYFNWEKIMHNSSHVFELPRNLFPNDEPERRRRGVVNQRQRVDAGPDKYDNGRGPSRAYAFGEGPPRRTTTQT